MPSTPDRLPHSAGFSDRIPDSRLGIRRRVVVTVRGMSKTVPYGDEWKTKGQRWMVLGLPLGWTEVDMWKNEIRGRGLWEMVSGKLANSR